MQKMRYFMGTTPRLRGGFISEKGVRVGNEGDEAGMEKRILSV